MRREREYEDESRSLIRRAEGDRASKRGKRL